MSGVFNAPLYGHTTWGSLFNSRQLLAMATYVDLARATVAETLQVDRTFGTALAATLGLLIDRLADLNCALCGWQLSTPNTAHVFTRWALPMMMDYGEVNPLAGAGGSPESSVWRIASAIRDVSEAIAAQGNVAQQSADVRVHPEDSVDVFVTDPPYYNAVPYADISDFFYVWLRRTIGDVFPELFSTSLTPKDAEICEMAGWDPARYSHKDKEFFERRMQDACERAREFLRPDGIAVIVFAHKSTAGWEAMLRAVVDAGWTITASWPIDTEMASRLRAQKSAALASSIHLVCRPRENADGTLRCDAIGDWREVLEALPKRIREWMPRLADEGIVGADAIFACLGPALEIFSRYSKVEKASGEVVTLREYLEQVWAAVSTEALSMIFQDADAAGLESDARFTAIVLWTLGAGGTGSSESTESEAEAGDDDEDESPTGKAVKGGLALEYDAARKIAQGLGVNLEQIGSVVEVKGDKARLLPVSERAATLFGKAEKAEAATKKRGKKATQKKLFDKDAEEGSGKAETVTVGDGAAATPGVTALDRVHQAMLLFANGRADALKRFVVEDGVGGDARFWKLAQSLSALYPAGSDEKRWVDGVLARKKTFGF
jgi:adenine-specific DNA methylase